MKDILDKLERKEDSHKGENGYVGVVAGSRDYTGAPALSGLAALRAGADLVTVLTSEEIRDTVTGFSENLVVETYPGGYIGEGFLEKARALTDRCDSVLVGPGLGCPRHDILKELFESTEVPVVIDADAIQPAIGSELSDTVLTPHRSETELILERYGSLQEFAELKEDTVVLSKGPRDMVVSRSETAEIDAGDPTMTVGGTGDVLSGTVASFMAQGLQPFEAARLGAEVNGKAGEIAARRYGNGALATDIRELVPQALKEVKEETG